MRIVKYKNKHQHLSDKFTCGNFVIDNFLKSSDALDMNQGITYILLNDDENIIIGFYNICTSRVDQIEIINGTQRYLPMGGAININYLAISKNFQRVNITNDKKYKAYLSDYLLNDCEERIVEIHKLVGATFITLYSTKEGYHLYHERNSYADFEDDMSTFMPESDKSCLKLYKWIDDIT